MKDRLLINPLLVGTIVGIACFLYAGKGDFILAFVIWLLFMVQDNADNVSCFHWELTCQLHSLQVELFHDQLAFAFVDLAEATTSEEERRASVVSIEHNGDIEDGGDSERDSGRDSGRSLQSLSGKELIETTEFFDETFVLNMSISFVDICKTMAYTSEHLANQVAIFVLLYLAAIGFLGLAMLLGEVTFEAITCALLMLYFAISNMSVPVATNDVIRKVRALSWDSYGELISHSLLFKGDDSTESNSTFEYKMVCNQAKHLLNMIQTSREGLKIGDVEFR